MLTIWVRSNLQTTHTNLLEALTGVCGATRVTREGRDFIFILVTFNFRVKTVKAFGQTARVGEFGTVRDRDETGHRTGIPNI